MGEPPGRLRVRAGRVGARRGAAGVGCAGCPTQGGDRWRRPAADPCPTRGSRFGPVPGARGACRSLSHDGRDAVRAGGRAPGRPAACRAREAARPVPGGPQAVDLPDRGHREHPRGRPPGAGRGARGRRCHRRHPVHGPVAAGLRARGCDHRGVRRHLRDPGELPDHAQRPGRRVQGAGPLRPPDQLRLRAVHARDRDHGGPRAPGHDAQRLDVRDPLPRHQPDPHLHRPALRPAGARPGGDHHQHRRGQLPDDRRRCRRGAHRDRQPAAQRVLRQAGGPGRLAARPRARVRDQPGDPRLVPPRAGPRPAGPDALPGRAAEVDAARPST